MHWGIYTRNRPPVFLCNFTSIKDQKIVGLRVKIAGKWKKAVASVNRLLGAQIFHSAVPRKGGMNLDFLAFGFDAQILFPLSDSFRWLDYPFHTFFPSTSNAVDLSSIVNCHHPIIIYRSCSSFGQWFYVTRAISRIKFTEVRVHNIYYRKWPKKSS